MNKPLLFVVLTLLFASCKKENSAPKQAPSILGTWNVTESSVLPANKNTPGSISIELQASSFVFKNDGTAIENFTDGRQITYIYMLSNFAGINYVNFIQTPGTVIYTDGYSLNNENFVINYDFTPDHTTSSLTRLGPLDNSGANYETVINMIK